MRSCAHWVWFCMLLDQSGFTADGCSEHRSACKHVCGGCQHLEQDWYRALSIPMAFSTMALVHYDLQVRLTRLSAFLGRPRPARG